MLKVTTDRITGSEYRIELLVLWYLWLVLDISNLPLGMRLSTALPIYQPLDGSVHMSLCLVIKSGIPLEDTGG